MVRIKEVASKNIFSYAFFALPGTLLHESAHYLVSLLLFGKPKTFSIFPKKGETGYILGSVQSQNIRWYNAFFISFAPLMLFGVAYALYKNYFLYIDYSFANFLLYIYLLVVLIESAIPSWQDIRVGLGSIGSLIYIAIIAAVVLYFCKDRVCGL